jgi:hypothetical protein
MMATRSKKNWVRAFFMPFLGKIAPNDLRQRVAVDLHFYTAKAPTHLALEE